MTDETTGAPQPPHPPTPAGHPDAAADAPTPPPAGQASPPAAPPAPPTHAGPPSYAPPPAQAAPPAYATPPAPEAAHGAALAQTPPPAHAGPPTPPAHAGPPTPPAHAGPPTPPAHAGPPTPPAHAGPPTPPAHAGPPTPPAHAVPSAPATDGAPSWTKTEQAPAADPAPSSAPAPAPVSPPAPAAPSVALRSALADVRLEVAKAVVGQDAAVSGLVIALLCRGHVLLEGVPGVAKTLLVRSLSAALDLSTKRVQFTPDLMPGDVTGSLVYDARTAEFSFREGPVFTNLLLADEINRTPPKTQASLLEAMEERQVTVDGTPRPLPDPFLVIATQNPVEYEGTYPLPEAQLDRFLLKLTLPLPEREDEVEVLARHAGGFDPRDLTAAGVRPVADTALLAAARAEVARVQVAREVLGYVVDVCRATRRSPSLALGVSPRGATALLATARAWAWLSGRSYVTPDDVKALAHPTLRHRVQLRAEAELEGVSTETVLDTVLASVPVPR